MSKEKLPDPLRRRYLVESELSGDKALEVAEEYIKYGRVIDALDFLKKAGAEDRLRSIRDESIESGDLFLFRSIAEILDEDPSIEMWRSLARGADSSGKTEYAAQANRQIAAMEQ